MLQLLQQLNLTHRRNGKSLLGIIHFNHLKGIKPIWLFIILNPGLKNFPKSALTNDCLINENLGSSQGQVVQVNPLLRPRQIRFQQLLLVLSFGRFPIPAFSLLLLHPSQIAHFLVDSIHFLLKF